MPDLLVVSTDIDEAERIANIGRQEQFRVKTATDLGTAGTWLDTRPFDLVCASERFSNEDFKDLASKLWKKYSSGEFVVFSEKNYSDDFVVKKSWELGLLGLRFVAGPNIEESLLALFRKVSAIAKPYDKDFRVLVVEDLEAPRDIICSFVEHLEGAFVHGVESGKKALEALKEDPEFYSCVITDVSMPEIPGYEFIEEVRSDQEISHIPIIVLTAFGTADILFRCLKAGASGFLVKPPSKDDFARELSRARRIILNRASPRLVEKENADSIRALLEEKGLI